VEAGYTDEEVAARWADAQALARWDAEKMPFTDLLGRLAAVLQSQVGALWVPNHSGTLLACIAFWSDPEVDARAFESATRSSPFPIGETLIGRPYRSRAVTWVHDLENEEDFVRHESARHTGLQSAVMFPVQSGNEVLAVFEFYSREQRPRNERPIAALKAIGEQLGEFFSGRRGELEARAQILASSPP
jgi:GAF domain-containing protein